jgi:RNA polymerase II subunit A-like phosphatase
MLIVQEAARLESQSRTDLLRSRRLSLIVDLDQTIIHTTVDPTVGEWLEDIRRSDAEEAAAAAAKGDEAGSSENPQPKPAIAKRRPNPNAEALRDVASFQLEDDMPPGSATGRRSGAERWYYTKPR